MARALFPNECVRGGCGTLKYLVVLRVYTARFITAAHVVQLMKMLSHFARIPSICSALGVDDSEKDMTFFFFVNPASICSHGRDGAPKLLLFFIRALEVLTQVCLASIAAAGTRATAIV